MSENKKKRKLEEIDCEQCIKKDKKISQLIEILKENLLGSEYSYCNDCIDTVYDDDFCLKNKKCNRCCEQDKQDCSHKEESEEESEEEPE